MTKHLIKRLEQLRQKARDEGIEMYRDEDGRFDMKFTKGGRPLNKAQRAVQEIFEEKFEIGREASKLDRRSFLKAPVVGYMGLAALSSGLALPLFSSDAHAVPDPNPQTIPGVTFANPPLPMPDNSFATVNEDFSTKVAVVIGGSTGIGKETAIYLKDVVGFGTVIATTRFDRNTYPDYPQNIELETLDITRPLKRILFVKKLKWRYGKVDFVHVNCGRVAVGTPLLAERTLTQLQQETNYEGPVDLIRRIEPLFPATGYARLVVTSSIVNNQQVIPAGTLGPNSDNAGIESFSYTESKRRLSAFCHALDASIKNTQITVDGTQWPSVRNPDLKISIVHPPTVISELGNKAFYLVKNPTPFLEESFADYAGGITSGGIATATAGKACGQLAQVENPPLFNYILDMADVNIVANCIQGLFYSFVGYESDISINVDNNSWPYLNLPCQIIFGL